MQIYWSNAVLKFQLLDELKETLKQFTKNLTHEKLLVLDRLIKLNYYAIGMKNKGIDFTKELNFASDASKVVKYYADGISS